MSVKDLFDESFAVTKEVSALKLAADKAHSLYMIVSKQLDGPRSESVYINYLKYKAELAASVARLMEYKREILRLINGLENPHYRLILENRYINRMTFEEIAETTCYDERHIYRLHKQAMAEIEQKI